MKPDLKLVADTGSQLEVDVFDPPPQQAEMPFAMVDGEPFTQLPKDLYIPPDALQVFLEAFEGPLDLLLYLIRRQNLDVLDIPIAEITRQYMHYIDMMQELQLELAGEYLLMAAMLAEIKSRMLLPHLSPAGEEEEDPRAELVRRLQEYERFKKAAADLDRLPRMERDTMAANVEIVERKVARVQPQVSLREMLLAFKDVLKRVDMFAHHHIRREQLSVRQRMSDILDRLRESAFIEFVRLFDPAEGRMGVTVTFIAVLELMKEGLLEIVQAEPYAPIHVRPASGKRHLTVVGEAAATVDFDTENVAALAQPAYPDENDDPDDEAAPAEVAAVAVPLQTGGETEAGEQASLQVGEPAVVATDASSAEAAVVAQPEAAPSEAGVASAEVAPELVVAQVGAEAIPAPAEVTASTAVTVVAESAVLDDPGSAAAQHSAGAVFEPAAVASSAAESPLQGVEPLTQAAADAAAAVPEPAVLAEPAVAASEVPVERLLPEEQASSAESPSLVAPAPAEMVCHADASDATATAIAEVVADAEPQVEADVAAGAAGGVVELEADQPAPFPTISWAASDLDVASGCEVQPVTALQDAESAATDPTFEHIDGAAPIHVDADLIQEFAGPLLETDLAMVPLATDTSHALPAGTLLLLESPAFAQFSSDTRSETQLGEPTDSVGAILESEPGALSQLVAHRVETQLSAGDEAALGTSPAAPVAEGSAPMAAELDRAEYRFEPPAAPELMDAEVEPPVLAPAVFDAVGAEVSAASDVAGGDAEAATAVTLQLEPWIASEAADSPPVATSDVEVAATSIEVAAGESADHLAAALAFMAAEPEPVVGELVADQPTALPLSDPGFEPAMMVFEAVDADSSPAATFLEADAESAAVAKWDLVPEEAAAAQQAAAPDVEDSVSLAAVADELLADVATDTHASLATDQEPESIAVGSIVDEPATLQLSDQGSDAELPAMTVVEAVETVEVRFAPALLDAETAAATALDLVPAVAADAHQAAASDAEALASLEVPARESGAGVADTVAADHDAEQPVPHQPTAPELRDSGLTPELPAMAVFEAAPAAASLVSTLLEADVEPAIAALDLLPAVAADAPPAAAAEMEAPAALEVVASESLHGIADVPAAVVAGQEPEPVVGAWLADPSIASQPSDPVLEPELSVVETVAAEARLGSTLLDADVEPALAGSDLVLDEAAHAPPVAASEVEVAVGGLDVVAGEPWGDVADAPASRVADQQPDQVVDASLADQPIALQLSDPGVEPALPAFEAVEVEANLTPTLFEADAEPAVAALDRVPAVAADAHPAAASGLEVVAGELLDAVADVPASMVAGQEPEPDVGASLAEQSSASQLSDPGVEPELSAMTVFEAAEPEPSCASAALATGVGPTAVAALDLVPTAVAAAPQVAEPDIDAAISFEYVDLEAGDGVTDTVAADHGAQQPDPAPPIALQLSDAGSEPGLADSGTVTEVAATLDFEPVMPVAAPGASAAATIDPTFEANGEIPGNEWFDDFVIDVPALGALQHQHQQGVIASLADPTDSSSLHRTGLNADVPAMTVFAAGAAVSPASVLTEAEAPTEEVAALALEQAAPRQAPGAPQAATVESAVSADQEANQGARNSEWFDDFVIDVPALGALQHQLEQGVVASLANPTDSSSLHSTGREADVSAMAAFEAEIGSASIRAATQTVAGSTLADEGADTLKLPHAVAVGALLEVEPAAAVPAQAGEAAVSVSESGLAAAMPELETAASMAVATPLSQAARFEADVAVIGQGEPSLAAVDFNVAAVTSRSGTVVEPAGVDHDGALPAAASLATEPVVAVASVAGALLPERQPSAATTPLLLQVAEPQVAVALSATRDAGPPLEQLRRESVTALLDDYPVGAMQWETRETNSVESAYEVDVAAFSSPLAFEHHLLRDDSD